MSDEQTLLLALLWPLGRGRDPSKAEACGLRFVGPERIERLAHGTRRSGLVDPRGRPSGGLAWDSEADVVRDLEALGWTLVERRPPRHHLTVLTLSKLDAETDPEQWGPVQPRGPVKRLVKRLLLQRLRHRDVPSTGTWPHDQ